MNDIPAAPDWANDDLALPAGVTPGTLVAKANELNEEVQAVKVTLETLALVNEILLDGLFNIALAVPAARPMVAEIERQAHAVSLG